MKASFLFPALLAATQFVGPASAENQTTAERDAEIIRRYDTNKDGKLDEAEVAAVKEEMLMSKMGKRDEKREKVQERRDEWLKEFDKNGDGKLDEAEKKTMETTLRARMEKNPKMMKRIDTNEDGKIDDQEWLAAREKLMGRLREGNDK
jgi:Ca2+-binding EF-hand superfamily protein